MAVSARIRAIRTTVANLASRVSASGLLQGEWFLITDATPPRPAIALSTTTYVEAQPYSGQLQAVASVSSNGIFVRTGSGTVVSRSIAAGTGISVSNGDAVAGNPTVSAAAATTTAIGALEIATAAEYAAATTSDLALTSDKVWAAMDAGVLIDGTSIPVNLAGGIDFTGASNAPLALGGNRTLAAPTGARHGKKGVLWFTASGATRTLTLDAAYLLADGVEEGPYSIGTTETLGLAYVVLGTTVIITGVLRI